MHQCVGLRPEPLHVESKVDKILGSARNNELHRPTKTRPTLRASRPALGPRHLESAGGAADAWLANPAETGHPCRRTSTSSTSHQPQVQRPVSYHSKESKPWWFRVKSKAEECKRSLLLRSQPPAAAPLKSSIKLFEENTKKLRHFGKCRKGQANYL